MAVTSDDKPGRRSNEPGPTGRRVAANLARIRTGRGLTTTQLSQRLSQLARPIPPTGVTKIEKGSRRVDSDDLVALALALGVSPMSLLLPETIEGRAQLTETVDVSAWDAWGWGDGHYAVPVAFGRDDATTVNLGFQMWGRPAGLRFGPGTTKDDVDIQAMIDEHMASEDYEETEEETPFTRRATGKVIKFNKKE